MVISVRVVSRAGSATVVGMVSGFSFSANAGHVGTGWVRSFSGATAGSNWMKIFPSSGRGSGRLCAAR